MKMLFVFLLFSASYCFSNNSDNDSMSESVALKLVGSYISEGLWDEAKNILDSLDAKSTDVVVALGLWYGDAKNPSHDKKRSLFFFEEAYKGGSREAQLFLIGFYLFSGDWELVDYSKGVILGRDLMDYYLMQIQEGNDKDGEIHRNVGKFYLFGIGVEKNKKLANEYIIKAADIGDKEAIEMLNN